MKTALILAASALLFTGCTPQSADTGATGAGSTAETAQEESAKPKKLADEDLTFMKEAARGGLAEVRMGQIGLSNGESQPVKDFSQRLVDDHTKANQELEKLAIKKGITLPDSVSEQHKSMLQHLESLKGREFDAAFQQHAVQDHQKDIEKFKTASAKAKDPEIRSFAEKTLPVLQRHLEAAQNLSGATTSQ